MTPLSMQVASGQQLLRIVRDGYLENRQIVSLDAGDTRTVSVVLTLAEATQPVEEAGGGGRLVYILGAVGGGVAAAVALGVSGGDSTGDGVVIAPPRTETRNGQVAGNAPGVPRMVEYAFTTRNGSPDIKVGRSPGRSDQELCDLGRNRLIHGFFWDLPEQYSLALAPPLQGGAFIHLGLRLRDGVRNEVLVASTEDCSFLPCPARFDRILVAGTYFVEVFFASASPGPTTNLPIDFRLTVEYQP